MQIRQVRNVQPLLVKCAMKNFILGLVSLNFVCFGESAVKVWKHDNDILNPQHWVGGKPGRQCEGLDLRDATESNLVVDQLNAREIILPNFTNIYFLDTASLSLDKDDTGELNCVKLRNDFRSHEWLDPSSWTLEDVEDDVAIPHAERIPCNYDDVVFPKGWMSSSCILDDSMGENGYLALRSFKFGDRYFTDGDLEDLGMSQIPIFPRTFSGLVLIADMSCDDPTGCLCGNDVNGGVCDFVEEPRQFDCLEPILPIDFCTKICGANILIKHTKTREFREKFDLGKIRRALADYTSKTHVSKVQNGDEEVIQVIFAEKEFSGSSLDEARDFHSVLLSDNSFGVTEALLITSGMRYHDGDITRTALSIFFGCLCGVLLVFGLIFIVNSPYFTNLHLANRYRLATPTLSSLFSRYEKMSDDRMRFQKSESVVSLQKAFDNPMYETPAPSTSSTSTVSSGDKDTTSGIGLENPLYNMDSFGESSVEEALEGNQLVDLSPLKQSVEQSEGDLIPLT